MHHLPHLGLLRLALPPSFLQGLIFFLGREVPREQLLFVIRAFGGEAAWEGEGSPYTEAHESITHQVRREWEAGWGWRQTVHSFFGAGAHQACLHLRMHYPCFGGGDGTCIVQPTGGTAPRCGKTFTLLSHQSKRCML